MRAELVKRRKEGEQRSVLRRGDGDTESGSEVGSGLGKLDAAEEDVNTGGRGSFWRLTEARRLASWRPGREKRS